MAASADQANTKDMRNRSFLRSLTAGITTALISTVVTSAAHGALKTIVIDPGHGGHDTGASQESIRESHLALSISTRLQKKLESQGHRVLLTRDKDEWISLESRAAFANTSGADLFISIHLNSSTDSRAHGKEFYFQNQLPVDEEALYLANRENHSHDENEKQTPGADRIEKARLREAEIARLPPVDIENRSVRADVKNILEDLDRSSRVRESSELAKALFNSWQSSSASTSLQKSRAALRGIRQAPFFLVSNVAMPSVLVEVGFLTHKTEGKKLQDESYQNELAGSLATGIQRYFNRQP